MNNRVPGLFLVSGIGENAIVWAGPLKYERQLHPFEDAFADCGVRRYIVGLREILCDLYCIPYSLGSWSLANSKTSIICSEF
jgi:hypothetical protein